MRITRARGDAQESVGRHRRLHLPRPRRRQRFARLLPRRRAQRAAARLRDARAGARRDGGERRGVAAARAPTALHGEPGPADAVDDPRWMVPPSLLTLLQPLETLRQPSGALYRVYAEGDSDSLARARRRRAGLAQPRRRRRRAGRRRLLDRRHDRSGAAGARPEDRRLLHRPPRRLPRARACAAPRTATSRSARSCSKARWCGWRRSRSSTSPAAASRRSPARSRRARARRSTAPAATPPATRACRIRSTTAPTRSSTRPSSTTRCRPRRSSRSWRRRSSPTRAARGSRLLASERAAMQKDGTPARDSLRGQLMRSDSARFLDRMFCIEQGFAACARPWEVQAAARAFGWNGGCADDDASCGKADLLFGGPLGRDDERGALAPGATAIAYGRLLSEPVGRKLGAPMHLMPPTSLDAGILRRCAAGPDGRRLSDDDWEKCKGGAVVDVVAEGWGQGHARASVLGVAGMMATLAAAANGAASVPRPHLVDARARRRRVGARCGRGGFGALARRAGAEPAAARRRRGDPERPVVQPSRRHGAHRVRAGLRREALPRHRLARRQDRHAELPERRPLARRAGAPVRARRAAVGGSQARRVQLAASVQVVRRRPGAATAPRTGRGRRRSPC